MRGYHEMFDSSVEDPAWFWADAATAIDWYRPPTTVLDTANPAVPLMVLRRAAQHLLQRPRPARRRRPRRPRRPDLRQPRHRHHPHLHLRAAARPGGTVKFPV
ncbi:acetyl-coenzyme A synthetase N-terminal domain-containing protein [Pseudonocardia alni]|uniref:acetyl-coenzyme A synthetase N-terminal domain-containing protein n=1 Tax=Pseudonocardia alni TaxID=33907 RepID=UPI0033293001